MSSFSGKRINWTSAAAIVIANMVGTGAFTTLGLQLTVVQNTWTILLLWALGGIIALLGAFSYAELGTQLPRSGGEFHFLSRLFHPMLGYLSGWVSLTVGFAAPIALSAMAMGAYLSHYLPFSSSAIALAAILFISVIHSYDIRRSSYFQNLFTVMKLLLILALLVAGMLTLGDGDNALYWGDRWQEEIWQPGFAVALIYVTYAFSGWNAAAYIVEEIRRPAVNLPRALVGGTVLVSALYILLQLALLRQAPLEVLRGQVEVGQIAAYFAFGDKGGQFISIGIALLLVSSISAMIWVGPRVTRAMADEHPIWRFLARDNAHGIPVRAIWLQSILSIAMILTSSFEQVLLYSGFILQLFTTITVAGVFVLRRRPGRPDGYRSPWYPAPQVVFLAISIWILGYLLYERTEESLLGLVNILIGAVSYWWSNRYSRRNGFKRSECDSESGS